MQRRGLWHESDTSNDTFFEGRFRVSLIARTRCAATKAGAGEGKKIKAFPGLRNGRFCSVFIDLGNDTRSDTWRTYQASGARVESGGASNLSSTMETPPGSGEADSVLKVRYCNRSASSNPNSMV